MTEEQFAALNLWDLEVRSIRFFQLDQPGLPVYDLEIELHIRPGVLGPHSGAVAGRLHFYNVVELASVIDVSPWVTVGAEFGDQRVGAPHKLGASRYILELRAPGGELEISAFDVSYEGPDIRKLSHRKSPVIPDTVDPHAVG